MMYSFLGLCLALAALLTINAIGSIVVASLWRVLKRFSCFWTAAFRADFLFTLRLFPILISVLGVSCFLIPSYIAYEPPATNEVVSIKLGLLAALSLAGIALAVWRGFSSFRATQKLLADWLRHAEIIQLENITLPTYQIQHPFPVIAIVGVLRPKLFIARSLLATLDNDELAAALAHETGHLKKLDNFKRGLLRVCRDALMMIPSGRLLDREWLQTSEAAADEYAARCAPSSALDLASALIKIARLIPDGATPTMPAGAFLMGDETGGIAWRVQRLTEIAEQGQQQEKRTVWLTLTAGAFFLALLLATASLSTNPQILTVLHTTIEHIVAALS